MTQLPRCRRSDTPSTPISQERMGILNVTPVTSTPARTACVRVLRERQLFGLVVRPTCCGSSYARAIPSLPTRSPRLESASRWRVGLATANPGHTPSFCDGVDERPGWLWIEASYVGALTAGLCGMSMKDEPPHEKGHGCGSRIA